MNNDNAITLLNENGVKKEYGRIPDLWHVAQYLKGNIDADDLGLSSIADQILEVWHMAHDLKAVIEGQGDARVLEPGAAEPEFMIGDVDRVKNNLSYVIELARHRADMWQALADGKNMFEQLDAFYECDKHEAEVMAHDTNVAVERVQEWFAKAVKS
jgi:hypothetical protein